MVWCSSLVSGKPNHMQVRLVVFGLGYCGAAVAAAATGDGLAVPAIARQTDATTTRAALVQATHVLSTVPPTDTPTVTGR